MIISKNPELREVIYDTIRSTVAKEREGIHLSDLNYCSRKAYFRKMKLSPQPTGELCVMWMTGFAFQSYMFKPPEFDLKHPRESFMAWSIVWEGSFVLGKGYSIPTQGKGKKYLSYVPSVIIGNTQYRLLESFQKLVGYGTIRQNGKTKSGMNYWAWTIKSLKEVKAFCEDVLPYLPAKKKQAELLLEYCGLRLGQYKSKSHSEREEQIYQEMKSLNKKGKFNYTSSGETEIAIDGIICTPDVFSGIEVKSTRQSSRKFDLESMEHWKRQILGYCKALNKLEYDLVVLFVCGNYAPPFPDVDCWHIETTVEEVEANWRELLERRDRLQVALTLGIPPEPDCTDREWKYCENVDLCTDTICYRKKQLKGEKKK